jgi:hypothetical protein
MVHASSPKTATAHMNVFTYCYLVTSLMLLEQSRDILAMHSVLACAICCLMSDVLLPSQVMVLPG